MRSKDIAAQYERAFSLLEKQLEQSQASLLQEQQSRLVERDWFRQEFDGLSRHLESRLDQVATQFAQLMVRNTNTVDTRFKELAEMIDRSHELHNIPMGDTPTMEELIEQAKSDPARRKLLETTLTELEFEDPLVGFN